MAIDYNYLRVIPRDLFNEAKLLKCMGMLSLKVLDCALPEGINIEFDECAEAFSIGLMEDGHLTIGNYHVKINVHPVTFKTVYNSKSPNPLLCDYQDCEYTVFDNYGNLDVEFVAFATSLN